MPRPWADGLILAFQRPARSGQWLGRAVLAGLLCLSAAAHTALGAENAPAREGGTPSTSPVRIQSEQLVADMNANTAEFSDQVRMVNDAYTITADILTIYFKPQAEGQSRMQSAVSSKDISRMVARGSVIVRTESLTASSDVAEYEPETGRVILEGERPALPSPAAARTSGRVLAVAGRPSVSDESIPGRVRVVMLPSPDRR
jgi:lipopolysaccharide export system protein LptA